MNLRKRLLPPQRGLKRLSDAELVVRARDGDKEAFGVLYERYLTKIYNYVYYRTGNHHDAEDVTAGILPRHVTH